MKKNKLAIGLSLTILVALYGGGVAQAVTPGDQIPSHNQRQKMQHSVRKDAAKRLKKLHEQAREQHLQHQIKNHGKG